MSKSFKREERAQARADQTRRTARRSKRTMQEPHTCKDRTTPSHMVKK